MSIEDSIKTDHNEYRDMIAKLQKTTRDDVEVRRNTFSTLRRKVFAHFIAEEITVFKDMLKVTEMRPLALELVEEHRAIRNLIRRPRVDKFRRRDMAAEAGHHI